MSDGQKLELELELRLKQLTSVEAEMFDELVGKTVLLSIETGLHNLAYGTLASHGINFVNITNVIETEHE